MLIKNLQIKFAGRQGDKLVFQTEAKAELQITDYLLGENFNEKENYYLALDTAPIKTAEEDQKKILNDLIGNDTAG